MDLFAREAADAEVPGASSANSTAPAEEQIFKLYHYHPSEVGAIIFLLAFLVTTLWHCWQLVRTRIWIMIPIIAGGICTFPSLPKNPLAGRMQSIINEFTVEMVGYGGRFASGKETPDWTLTPYILQAILLLVAPALFAATIYMELGRIVTLIDGEGHSLIPRKWMTKLFVIGDVLSFFLQGGGKS